MIFQMLKPGEPESASLDSFRQKIAELKESLASVESRPRTQGETRGRILRTIEESMKLHDPLTGWAGFSSFNEFAPASLPDPVSFADLAYLLGAETLADAVMSRLQASPPPGGPGITAAERAKKLAALQSDLDAAEADEEVEILALESAGYTVLRREDARPEILFAVWAEHEQVTEEAVEVA